MVHAFGTPKRHPESGVFLFRKRVPAHLIAIVGRSEIKFSLKTRDPVVARIRNLEDTARIERAWSKIDGAVVEALGRGPAGPMVAEASATEAFATPTTAMKTAAVATGAAVPAAAAEVGTAVPAPKAVAADLRILRQGSRTLARHGEALVARRRPARRPPRP